jgi:hypothetical protein
MRQPSIALRIASAKSARFDVSNPSSPQNWQLNDGTIGGNKKPVNDEMTGLGCLLGKKFSLMPYFRLFPVHKFLTMAHYVSPAKLA